MNQQLFITNSTVKKLFAFLLCTALLFSCGQDSTPKPAENQTPPAPKNGITKVSLALEGCLGKCQSLNIEIDSSLQYNYYGGAYANKPGGYTGRIDADSWETLNKKFEAGNFRQLDSAYLQTDDDQETDLIIYFNGQRKHIRAAYSDLPAGIKPAYAFLIDSYKKLNLKPTTEKLVFENPIPEVEPEKPVIFTVPK